MILEGRRAGATASGAPTAASGHAGDGSVTLTSIAPGDDGDAAITSYRITPTASAYTDAVFSDDFESGSLSAWTQTLGTGSAAVTAAAAGRGAFGLRLSNAAGEATLEAKTLPRTVDDSSTRYTASGSVAIDTGAGSAPGPNAWMALEVCYEAASGGPARLFIGGQTQASWGTTADLTHSDGYRILQLWNYGSGVTSDFDDVTVAPRPAGTSAPARRPR